MSFVCESCGKNSGSEGGVGYIRTGEGRTFCLPCFKIKQRERRAMGLDKARAYGFRVPAFEEKLITLMDAEPNISSVILTALKKYYGDYGV